MLLNDAVDLVLIRIFFLVNFFSFLSFLVLFSRRNLVIHINLLLNDAVYFVLIRIFFVVNFFPFSFLVLFFT